MPSKKRALFDLHCHFLPQMDDGCKSVEESAAVLHTSWKQGVQGVIATSHYYPQETVSRFLQRRKAACDRLVAYLRMQPVQIPQVCLGAEVAYHNGLIYEEQLEYLCIGHSRYMLLELPFSKWSPNVLRDVQTMHSVRGITPILAHLERYFKIQEKSHIAALMDSDVLVQMNAEYLLGTWTQHKGKQLLKQRKVQVLGSDCHNMTTRPPRLGQAVEELDRSHMSDLVEEICWTSGEIFRQGMNGGGNQR